MGQTLWLLLYFADGEWWAVAKTFCCEDEAWLWRKDNLSVTQYPNVVAKLITKPAVKVKQEA